jgi:hypothetical protein
MPRLRLHEVRIIDIPNAMVYYVDERRRVPAPPALIAASPLPLP